MYSTPDKTDIKARLGREELLGLYSLDHTRTPGTEDTHACGMTQLGRTVLGRLMAKSTTSLTHHSVPKSKRPSDPTVSDVPLARRQRTTSPVRNIRETVLFLYGESSDEEESETEGDDVLL